MSKHVNKSKPIVEQANPPDAAVLAFRKVHEGAWFEVATRIAGSEPPFVPIDGNSVNLNDEDHQKLTEFFIACKYMSWATGIGSVRFHGP